MDEKKQSERRVLPTSPLMSFLDALHVISRGAVPNPERLTHLMNRAPLYKEFSNAKRVRTLFTSVGNEANRVGLM
jgi:hypothetical protein